MRSHYWYFSIVLHILFVLKRVIMSYIMSVAGVTIFCEQMSEKCHLTDKVKIIKQF